MNIFKRCILHPEMICSGNHHQMVLHGGVCPISVGKEKEARVELSIRVTGGEHSSLLSRACARRNRWNRWGCCPQERPCHCLLPQKRADFWLEVKPKRRRAAKADLQSPCGLLLTQSTEVLPPSCRWRWDHSHRPCLPEKGFIQQAMSESIKIINKNNCQKLVRSPKEEKKHPKPQTYRILHSEREHKVWGL